MRQYLVVLSKLIISLDGFAQLRSASFKVHVRKTADKVEMIEDGKTLVVNVSSSDGIGSGSVARIGGKWPPNMCIRINLRNLEFVRLSNRNITLEGRLGDEHWTQVPQQGQDLPAAINRTGASVEIQIPPVLTQEESKEITIEWINEYRQ